MDGAVQHSMKRAWHIAKRILAITGILVLLLLIAGFIIVRYYEDDVVAYAVKRISSRLSTEATVKSVDLVLWDHFPNASLLFKDVLIRETFSEKDTLLYAEKIWLSFNVFDLFSGNYDVRQVDVENAAVNLCVNEKGTDNWHVWKDDPDSTNSGERMKVRLRGVELKNIAFVYENRKTRYFMDIQAHALSSSGDFSAQSFDMEIEGGSTLNSLVQGESSWGENREINVDATLHAEMKDSQYTISRCEAELDGIPVQGEGVFVLGAKATADLAFRADKIEMADLVRALPQAQQTKLDSYDAAGLVTAHVKIIRSPENTSLTADFVLRDGELEHKPSGVMLANVECEGNYTSHTGHPDKLELTRFDSRLGGGELSVMGTVKDLSSPEIQMDVKAQIDLGDMRRFFDLDTLAVCEGKLAGNAHVAGTIRFQPENSSPDLKNIEVTGDAALTNGRLQLKQSNQEFKNLGAQFRLNGNDVTVNDLIGEVNGCDFKINGTLKRLIPYLATDTAILVLDASLESEHIDMGRLLEAEESTSRNEVYHFGLPSRVRASMRTSIGTFTFREFEARDIRGQIILRDGGLAIDPVTFATAGGDLLAQVSVAEAPKEMYSVRCLATLEGIDITALFTEFENFGQTFITDKNLHGKTTAKVQYESLLSSSLEIPPSSVRSLIDISVEDGQITGLESLQQIAEYIRKNKLVAPFVNEDKFAEKLKDVRFSKLENVIEISNRKITLPLMDVHSSAMDISARGTHGFDNVIDYTIGFKLRDILIRKEKEWIEEDDGLGKQMFIYMRGTTAHPEFGIDKTAGKEERREEMEQEKQNMKSLLKEEFGLFKKDDTVGPYSDPAKSPGTVMHVEWDENAPPTDTVATVKDLPAIPVEKTPGPAKPKKKLPKWLEEKE